MQFVEHGRFPATHRAWSQFFSLAAPLPQYQNRSDGPVDGLFYLDIDAFYTLSQFSHSAGQLTGNA